MICSGNSDVVDSRMMHAWYQEFRGQLFVPMISATNNHYDNRYLLLSFH
jgi:hypothetical protein